MIIFHQHHVVQTEAVINAAACHDHTDTARAAVTWFEVRELSLFVGTLP